MYEVNYMIIIMTKRMIIIVSMMTLLIMIMIMVFGSDDYDDIDKDTDDSDHKMIIRIMVTALMKMKYYGDNNNISKSNLISSERGTASPRRKSS